MNIYSPTQTKALLQGLLKTIVRNMKLIIKNLPKDWVRLTILKAESYTLLLILQENINININDLNKSLTVKRYWNNY